MIGMQYNRHTIIFCHIVNMQGAGYTTGNICLQFVVGHSFAGNELCTAIGKLDDNRVNLLLQQFQVLH